MCYLKLRVKRKARAFMQWASDVYWCKGHTVLRQNAYWAILGVSIMLNIVLFVQIVHLAAWQQGMLSILKGVK